MGTTTSLAHDAASSIITASLTAITYAARDTHLYEFRLPDGQALPGATAGSHIDIHLPNGLVRQYSLVNWGNTPDRYIVGVKNDPNSRGGSRYMHEQLRVGSDIQISAPRNNFPLDESVQHTVLVAGGIGITPIWCMMTRLEALGKSWELHYSCRSRTDAAFLAELATRPNVHLHFDDENEGRLLDLAAIAANAPAGSHAYCCGPTPMLGAFENALSSWPANQVHVEYFTAKHEAANGGFTVELQRSGKTFHIPEGKSILETLNDAGMSVPQSCLQGVCGACETRVISGIPDHRDAILSEPERAANETMMICCSGSKTDLLVLDL
ncbi:PDR/VanB family oxidoreductase [Neopusillimonas aromaticivorans]|uniref:PDR/VanB family oxidoreductase n=1 Tax=Neopusillimonas aromaticivorans TaxID=2979868 RepID=UPI002597E4F9|nr:PDR/VanB family oxidoreductase [Neopusillimonas aromaticivorans]WJJ94489.1 PDR/VanB family oxidoreductase [Neopusillimonas aromaticivorans]